MGHTEISIARSYSNKRITKVLSFLYTCILKSLSFNETKYSVPKIQYPSFAGCYIKKDIFSSQYCNTSKEKVE